jgi:hypothetical protein
MQPDPANLLKHIGLMTPLIGFYDAPEVSPFEPLVSPKPGGHVCTFAFYKAWHKGKTLHEQCALFHPLFRGYHPGLLLICPVGVCVPRHAEKHSQGC